VSEERQRLGRWGEQAAAAYLKQSGFRVVASNVRTPVGELDLVARHGRLQVFVEVKTRRSRSFGAPAEAVDARKQRQVIRAAQWYLAQDGHDDCEIRFDVVAVDVENGRVRIEHIPAAFEAHGDRG